jgi:hypothetical protein
MNYSNQNYLITVDTGKSKVIKQLAGDVEKEEQDPSESIKQKDDQQRNPTIMTELLKDKELLQKKIKSGDGSHIEAEDR